MPLPRGKNKFAEEIPPKRSKTRKEIEAIQLQNGIIMERRISVLNLENGEILYFDCYHEAFDFLKGRKGRWYITTLGIRSLKRAMKK